jgi:aminoglycoside phosphotransferase family enzyme
VDGETTMTSGTGVTSLRGAPTTADRVAFLSNPASYPDRPDSVESVETHKSWVFLTDRFAFKLKKPIRFASVDFTTPASWKRNCLAEARLNRRLAPDVYLGVVPLSLTRDGQLCLGPGARPVDWLVWMRRLPRDRTLQRLAQTGTLTDEHLKTTSRRFAGFYRSQPPARRSGEEYRQVLRIEHDRNRRDLQPYAGTVAVSQVRDLLDAHSAMLNEESELFDARVTASHVIEGHGDLRPEHVCLEDSEPMIFDCLEFDRRLR